MKQLRELIIAVLIAAIPIVIILLLVYLEAFSAPKPVSTAYEPYKAFSIPMDTSLYKEWEDKFDTSYVDSWGITHYTRKEYEDFKK